jgi:hypothetical protein
LTTACWGSAPYAHAAWRYIETVRIRLDVIHRRRLVTRSLHAASLEISAINCIRSRTRNTRSYELVNKSPSEKHRTTVSLNFLALITPILEFPHKLYVPQASHPS